jgi:putative ABC transport system permease protein
MFKNYFSIAVRQLQKQKMYSAIKIGGFAIGIAACLLIGLYIRDELRYDRTYPDADRICRIIGVFNDNGKIEKWVSMTPPTAKVVEKDFPEVEKTGRLMPFALFYGAGSNYVCPAGQEKSIYEDGFTYADQSILDILKLPMVYGYREQALAQPNTIVLSKKKADKYFPHQDCVGKIIFLNNDKSKPYKIGAVMEDFPTTSNFQYDFLLTLTGVEFWNGEQTGWGSQNYETYILLRPGTNMKTFEKKLSADLVNNYIVPDMVRNGNKDVEKTTKNAKFELQSISDVHLKSFNIYDYQTSHGDMRFVWLFGAIACFILVIACINFINLSTAKSANRAKEVGLRKVIGAFRSGLVIQFLTESFLFSFLSFLFAILLAWGLLPFFNILSAKSLKIPWTEWWLFPIMIGAAAVIGFLAGLYPSFYLSSFKPISVLKGNLSRGTKNSLLRNGLVVFQFTTSIILIISTVIIYRQTKFLLTKKLGYDKDQVLLIQGTNTLGNEVKNLKLELLKLPQVKSVSISDYIPVSGSGTKRNGNTFYNEGKTKEESGVGGQFWLVDDAYIKTFGMKIIAGRNFSSQMISDSQAVVINHTMAKKLNLKDPIGKRITNGWTQPFNVVGMVEDFNFESMRDSAGPLCLHLGNSSSIVSVKINTADIKNLVPAISAIWKTFAPAQPIRYTFLDESFANMYADVQRMGRIFTSFAMLAIIIACLGLFALSAFMAEQRNKEIGIRKVLGASAGSITTMLSKDFVKLVLIAIVIASPVAWWAMTKWLEDFAYRADISWWVFFVSGLMAVLVALVTISFQSVKAGLANPVKSLRAE